jgi:hypothetical protein
MYIELIRKKMLNGVDLNDQISNNILIFIDSSLFYKCIIKSNTNNK